LPIPDYFDIGGDIIEPGGDHISGDTLMGCSVARAGESSQKILNLAEMPQKAEDRRALPLTESKPGERI